MLPGEYKAPNRTHQRARTLGTASGGKAGKVKQVKGGYTSGSPSSSRLSSSDPPASASKGFVASSPPASPSDEGGINSTSSRSRPSAAAPRPCRGRRGSSSGPADSPAPWLGQHRSWLSPAGAATLSFRLRDPQDMPVASHSVSDIERRAPPDSSTPQQPLPLLRRHRPWPSPLQIPLGGLKSRGKLAPRISLCLG
ncbi:hypothetical protein Cgig2_007482 [Carnegiea gigantea]|uniref:Uncharacterized protein n=1 Tax=Carnegiea gigantea TaxID=171969 RepID=A0A9Q1QEB0_9CARY|nr:hypothetical protein Cgig2_007482 [Carnegiea gigantea]